jgi:meso-butanediol dehydrogenase/(S,S)-butanediol dehydrogenase/diacetyl reductase
MSGFNLDSKVVLITGGARGIGKGMAQAFLEAGAKVMIADLGPGGLANWDYKLAGDDELSQTVTELTTFGDIQATRVDVTDKASCVAAVAATIEAFGQLDVLINNAGVVQSGSLANFSEAHWDQTFAVNSKGIFLMSQAALPHLRSSAPACIINTASIAGKQGYPNMTAYCGSKFAAIGITQSLANELAADNIRVNAICPGMVGTAMWLEHLLPNNPGSNTNKDQDFEAMMAQTIPLGRPQTAQDMGQAAVYLASADNVTGVALNVAGGFEMH